MNRKSRDLRRIYLRLKKQGKSVIEIAGILNVSRQTIYNWQKLTEESIFKEPPKSTRSPSLNLNTLKEYIDNNPFLLNREIAEVFNCSKNTIQKWRQRLGFTRKKAKSKYKEANPELKKSLNQI